MKKHGSLIFWGVVIVLAYYFRTQILGQLTALAATAKADFQGVTGSVAATLPSNTSAATATAAQSIADTVTSGASGVATPPAPAPVTLIAFPVAKNANSYLERGYIF